MAEGRPAIRSLAALAAAEQACTRCPLYRDAIQAVPGEGARGAAMMLVGEQPGDSEDRRGRPFVGPAGHMLDRALEEAGIDRRTLFVTNAVKHFKHEPRGKRRLHKRPNAGETDACRWWLELERKLVKPRLVVAMGVTAARGVLGRSVTVSSLRGEVRPLEDGGAHYLVTTHPSALLRGRQAPDWQNRYAAFVADLAAGAEFIAAR